MTGRSDEDRARSAAVCEASRRAGFGPATPSKARKQEIMRLKRMGATHMDIAELFGISEQSVQAAGSTTRRLTQAEWRLIEFARSASISPDDCVAFLVRVAGQPGTGRRS